MKSIANSNTKLAGNSWFPFSVRLCKEEKTWSCYYDFIVVKLSFDQGIDFTTEALRFTRIQEIKEMVSAGNYE